MHKRSDVAVVGAILCVVFVLAPTYAAANDIRHQRPWEWSPQERAAARLDPIKREARLRGVRFSAKHPRPMDVIDGARNPELFFVTELFEMVVRSAFVLSPRMYPGILRARGSDLFRDDAEWSEFASITAEYARVLQQEVSAANALDSTRVTAVQEAKCVAASRALRQARAAFGRQRFDRMLYETVRASISFGSDTDMKSLVSNLVAREQRCQ